MRPETPSVAGHRGTPVFPETQGLETEILPCLEAFFEMDPTPAFSRPALLPGPGGKHTGLCCCLEKLPGLCTMGTVVLASEGCHDN
jgi:hypothetical protein